MTRILLAPLLLALLPACGGLEVRGVDDDDAYEVVEDADPTRPGQAEVRFTRAVELRVDLTGRRFLKQRAGDRVLVDKATGRVTRAANHEPYGAWERRPQEGVESPEQLDPALAKEPDPSPWSIVFPAESELVFTPSGDVAAAILGAPVTIAEIELPAGTEVGFSESGRLTVIAATQTLNLQGIPCQGTILLHDNGKLESFTVARPTTLGGVDLEQGDRLTLSRAGQIETAAFPREVELADLPVRPASVVSFHPNGKVAALTTGAPARLFGRDIPAGARVMLSVEGRIQRIE